MRLYDPKQGKITINGKNIRDFDLQELHNYIGIVNQNPDLFNAPLTDNIGYGITNCHQKDIEKASDIANCTGFITKFRGKFDTFAGSRGSNLSGGQKQRIAIARAAIKDPQVLILDEATSSLGCIMSRFSKFYQISSCHICRRRTPGALFLNHL